jgi:predicted RNA-binding Zn ribbon-like protein
VAKSPAQNIPSSWLPTLRLGDSLALDFLNTVVQMGGEAIDLLASDAQVVQWLDEINALHVPIETADRLVAEDPGKLHTVAIDLRAASRESICQRKQGHTADSQLLNQVLARGCGHYTLLWEVSNTPQLVRHLPAVTSLDLLIPIAEAVADLLVHGDFDLVRKCENPACSLWFYDRTKSHRRRWCSTALCGNRMKVAAFRERQRGL